MKKPILYGIAVATVLGLAGCTPKPNSESARISSLEAENSSLKASTSSSATASYETDDEETDVTAAKQVAYGTTITDPAGLKVAVAVPVDATKDHFRGLDADEHGLAVTVTLTNTSKTALHVELDDFELRADNDDDGDLDDAIEENLIIDAGKSVTTTLYFGTEGVAPYSVQFGKYLWQAK